MKVKELLDRAVVVPGASLVHWAEDEQSPSYCGIPAEPDDTVAGDDEEVNCIACIRVQFEDMLELEIVDES